MASILLIVEDDPDVLRAARVALAPLFEKIVTRSSPATIAEDVTVELIEAVLLDMNFVAGQRRGEAGLDALAQILECDPDVSVVLMTAYGGVALAVEALKRGAADFVLKPWRNEKLVDAVTAAVQRTRKNRAAHTFDLETLERETIQKALAQHAGNISAAATALGLSRPALYRRMMKHSL